MQVCRALGLTACGCGAHEFNVGALTIRIGFGGKPRYMSYCNYKESPKKYRQLLQGPYSRPCSGLRAVEASLSMLEVNVCSG